METLHPNKIVAKEEISVPEGYKELEVITVNEAKDASHHSVVIKRVDDGRFLLIDTRTEIIDSRGLIAACKEVQTSEDTFKERYESTKEVNDDFMLTIKKQAEYGLQLERMKIREIQQRAIKDEEQKKKEVQESHIPPL